MIAAVFTALNAISTRSRLELAMICVLHAGKRKSRVLIYETRNNWEALNTTWPSQESCWRKLFMLSSSRNCTIRSFRTSYRKELQSCSWKTKLSEHRLRSISSRADRDVSKPALTPPLDRWPSMKTLILLTLTRRDIHEHLRAMSSRRLSATWQLEWGRRLTTGA